MHKTFLPSVVALPEISPEKKTDRKGNTYYVDRGGHVKTLKGWHRWNWYKENRLNKGKNQPTQ